MFLATIKTIEYRCPHCNKKLPYAPQNDYCAIKSKYYGNPYQTCRKCKKTYRNSYVFEPAETLTLKDQVPFWITDFWTIFLSLFIACLTLGTALIVIIPVYLAACYLGRKRRQAHKNQVLLSSRTRLKDPEYFLRYLFSAVYLPDKSKLTPQALAMIHVRAISVMEADQPLSLGPIVRDVLSR